MTTDTKIIDWQICNPHVFWGEIAPAEHVVQIYENDVHFLDLLESFVSSGIKVHECVVLITTSTHMTALEERLKKHGHNINELHADDQLIVLDAEETLAKFMVKDWPDEKLFNETISGIISRAHTRNRKVRAFGEMVALLWAKGLNGATVQLESLWDSFCQKEAFSLFCAYPKSGFTQDPAASIETICCHHSKMIAGNGDSNTQLYYINMPEKAG